MERPKLTAAQEHFTAGVYLRAQERLQEAIAEYDKAIELDPGFATAYLNRGNIFALLGQYQRALQDYDKAIRLDPQSFAAYYNRSVTYTELQRDREALEDLNETIRLDPQFTLAHLIRAASTFGWSSMSGPSRITLRPSVSTLRMAWRTLTEH